MAPLFIQFLFYGTSFYSAHDIQESKEPEFDPFENDLRVESVITHHDDNISVRRP
jgi:hypothetical protein